MSNRIDQSTDEQVKVAVIGAGAFGGWTALWLLRRGAERVPRQDALERVRALLRERFPGMAGAPLVETRVCQYTNTADGHYLVDRHPRAANAWIVGGGSGHGFKLCPVLGEHVADWVLGREEPLAKFSLERLDDLKDTERSQLSGKEQTP